MPKTIGGWILAIGVSLFAVVAYTFLIMLDPNLKGTLAIVADLALGFMAGFNYWKGEKQSASFSAITFILAAGIETRFDLSKFASILGHIPYSA